MAILGVPLVIPAQQFFGNTGLVNALGFVRGYLAGTSTEAPLYTSSALDTEHTQPIELDSAGRDVIFLDPAVGYRIVVTTALGASIFDVDGLRPIPGTLASLTVSGAFTVNGLLTAARTVTNAQAVSASLGLGAEATAAVVRLRAYSPAIEFLDKDATQNWHVGLDDNENNSFVIGRGYGPGQAVAPSLTIDPTTSAVTVGAPSSTTPGAVFNVVSSDAYGASDWVAWFRRDGTTGGGVSCHLRAQHFSGALQPEIVFSGLVARGTMAVPLPVLSGDNLMIMDGRGYDGSAVDHTEYAVGWSDGQASLVLLATENWSGTAHGAAFAVYTTPNGSLVQTRNLFIDQDGSFESSSTKSTPAWVFNSTHANGGVLAIRRSGIENIYIGTALAALGGSYSNQDAALYATQGTVLLFSNTLAAPAGVTNGAWWVECTGVSPSRVCAIKVRDGGSTRTIGSVTY